MYSRFHDEVGWAFKMFDIDNSGVIVVEEIHESIKVDAVIINLLLKMLYQGSLEDP